MLDVVRAERLDLVPMTPQFLRSSLAGQLNEASSHIGLVLPDGWPDIPEILQLRLGQLEADPALQPWLLRAMALRATGELVGHIGFHTFPGADYLSRWSPRGVEFGFSVFPSHRRKGYAREASLALMKWAREVHGVTNFVLAVSPENRPSQALAASLGFVRVGEHFDEVDGIEDIFELVQDRVG